MERKKWSVPEISKVAFMTAVLCVLGPLSLPIGFVPVSLTNLGIYFAVALLGWRKGTISYLLYLGMGCIGLPVFSGFSAGVGKLWGPTGGYLIGFIFLAVISGWFFERFLEKKWINLFGMLLGMLVCYLFGTTWLAYQGQMTFQTAWMVGVVPFLIGDFLKMVIALVMIPKIKMPLKKAGYIH